MRIVWTPGAREDLHRIQAYYSQKNPRAARRIWTRIAERVAKQAHTPHAAPLERGGPARRLVVSRTRYIVIYEVVGEELRVLAVVHGMQDR